MRIIDEIKEKELMFVEQDVGVAVYYEVYYLGTKLLQVKNKFNEAVKQWSNIVTHFKSDLKDVVGNYY